VLIQAGNAARFLSDPGTAAGYYEQAGKVRPESWIPSYNLACLRAIGGDPDSALTLLGDSARLGLVAPRLLDGNPDLERVRGLPGWGQLETQVRMAAAAVPRSR
jgi:hypothetical protein